MILQPKDSLIVALDVSTLEEARDIVRQLRDYVGLFKVGLQLFCSVGPQGVRELAEEGTKLFLDLKLHDIPNTVAGALRSASLPGVSMITVHALGGQQMLRAAAQACTIGQKLLAITMLTSMDEGAASEVGVKGDLQDQVVSLARLAIASGADGVVASAREVAALRMALGPVPLIVTPGIRMLSDGPDDQARTADPVTALKAGSNYLVVGRPILQARDRVRAAQDMVQSMQRAFLVP